MKSDQKRIVQAAYRGANFVLRTLTGEKSADLLTRLNLRASPGELAYYIAQNKDVSVEVLYRDAAENNDDASPWCDVDPNLKTMLEIFRATFLVLEIQREAEGCAKAERAKIYKQRGEKPLPDRGIYRRSMRQVSGMSRRVKLK